MASSHRRVIREHRLERELRSLFDDPVEGDQFIEAAEWVLANEPETGIRSNPNSSIWTLPMAAVAGMQVTLYYTFDAETVWLFSIEAEA